MNTPTDNNERIALVKKIVEESPYLRPSLTHVAKEAGQKTSAVQTWIEPFRDDWNGTPVDPCTDDDFDYNTISLKELLATRKQYDSPQGELPRGQASGFSPCNTIDTQLLKGIDDLTDMHEFALTLSEIASIPITDL